MSRQKEHTHAHACGRGPPPGPDVAVTAPAHEVIATATEFLRDPPSEPADEIREQNRKRRRSWDTTAEHEGESPMVEHIRGPERLSPRLQEGVSTRSTPRKRRFREEPRFTKQVPLGTDATCCIIIGAQLTIRLEAHLVGFLRENADVFALEPSDVPGFP